jgi:hypothetical protein
MKTRVQDEIQSGDITIAPSAASPQPALLAKLELLGGVAHLLVGAGVVDLSTQIFLINHPSHDLRSCCPPNPGGQFRI